VTPRTLLVACGAATVLVLGGCAVQEPDLAPRAAAELQQEVGDVARAAAQGRYDAAMAAAARVRAALEEAAAAEEISVARYAEIEAALSRTEEELASAADEAASSDQDEDAGEPDAAG
jgi:hypothetical protein